MSTKHFYNNLDGLVVQSLKGIISQNPKSLGLIEDDKVVFNTKFDKNKVAVISGGGAGHEPAMSGYVGAGMLAAGVCGDVFASPSARQVTSGISVTKAKESILVITNYTGDMLHFGLAAEKINAKGDSKVGRVIVADDVAVGKSKGGLVGRRGLAGTILTIKLIGAATESGESYDASLRLGQGIVKNLVTLGTSLEHCHVPGRNVSDSKEQKAELGMGIHNEPGFKVLSPLPSAKDIVEEMLVFLIDPNDSERGFVSFDKSDSVFLMLNNLGGTSVLEMGALLDETLRGLSSNYSIHPTRVVQGTLMTSLNGPGFSITLLNATKTAAAAGISVEKLEEYFDAPTDAIAWPKGHTSGGSDNRASQLFKSEEEEVKVVIQEGEDVKVDAKELNTRLRLACDNVVVAEPMLTLWDEKMGDGDCGETIKNMALGLLEALDAGVGASGSILEVVDVIVELTESKMGGTLGAIFGIYFAALLSSLRQTAKSNASSSIEDIFATAAASALANLRTHTPAKVGDRTVMDVMIPFCAEFVSTKNFAAACTVAHEAAEGTRKITPKLGRATYVGGLEGKLLPPDPGAMGIWAILTGLNNQTYEQVE